MALVDGAPSIRLEGDEKRALALIPEGRLLLSKAQAFTKRAEIPTYSMSRRVSEDEYIYVLVAGGQNVIQISAGVVFPDHVHEETEEVDPTLYPDFLSGIVFNGFIGSRTQTREDGSKVTYSVVEQWAPTNDCARVQDISPGRQSSRRLAVRPHAAFPEWNSTNADVELSQYALARSAQWSGMMKKVVQVVMGLGKINKNKLRDPKNPKTTAYMDAVEANGVQVQFDYKFMRTHGIHRGADNRLWLVEISSTKGVVAMPLPIFPGSDKPSFFLRAQQRGDASMMRALEELGCLPTGESFPTGQAYKDKLAKGDIIQLRSPEEMQDFYRLSGYSSVCGWSFNNNGSEAHNVGYYWPEDDVFQKGYWYQLSISIGPINTEREKDQPIASGSASLRLQSQGFLYSAPVRNSFIPVKYYEPLLPGLLSHSAKPLGPSSREIECDTVVFVAFMNGDLKVARYFKPKAAQPYSESTDDRSNGECLLEGSWTWTSTTGNRALPTMPYTNDIDNRDILEENFSTSTLTSNSVGFDPPAYSDFIESPETCYIRRQKIWKQVTTTEQRGGETRGACFVAPGNVRDAYYYFEGHSYNGGRRGSTNTTYASIQDPNVYYGWRRFPRINPPPWPGGWGCATTNCGGAHTERRVMCWVYEGDGYSGPWVVGGGTSNDCRSYADSGQWASQCQDVVSLCSAKAPIRKSTSSNWDKGADFEGKWHFMSDGLYGPVSGPINQNQFEYAMSPSPDPLTDIAQFIFAEHSAIGEDCVLYTKGFNAEMVVTGFSSTPILPTDGMPTFIGVNLA